LTGETAPVPSNPLRIRSGFDLPGGDLTPAGSSFPLIELPARATMIVRGPTNHEPTASAGARRSCVSTHVSGRVVDESFAAAEGDIARLLA